MYVCLWQALEMYENANVLKRQINIDEKLINK